MSLRDLDIDEKGLWIVTDPDDFRANEQNYTLPRHISPKSTDYENLFKSPDDIKAEAEKELLAERDQKDTTLASAREQFQLPEEYGEEAKKGELSQLGYAGTILKNLSLLAPTLISKLPEGASYVQPSAFRVTGRGIEEPPAAVPSGTPVLTSPEALLEDPTEKTTFRGDLATPQNIGGFAELDPADRLTAADQFSDSVAASEKGLKIIKDWLPTSGLDETQQKLVWEEVSVPSDYNALLPYEAQTKLQKSFEARQEWLRRAAYYSPQSDPDGTIFSRGYDQFVARPFTDGLTAIMSALEANMDTQTYLELQPTADERVIPVIESGDRVLQREKEKKARVDLTQGEIPDITSGDVDAAIAAGWLKPNYPTVLGEDQLKVGPFLPDAPEEERSPIPGAPKSTEALKIEVYNHRHKQARLNEETSYPFTEEIITPSYTQLDLEIDGAIALKVGLSLAALYATGGAAAPAVPAILGKGLAASLASKLVKPRQMTSRFLKSILSESDLRKVSAIIGLQNRTALRSKAERLAVDARETLAKVEEIVDVAPSQQAVAALTTQRAAVAQAEEALRLANRPVEKYKRYLDKLVSSEDSLRTGLTGISIEYAEFLAKMSAVTTSYNAAGTAISTLYENPEDMSFGEHLFFGLTGSIAAITSVRMGKSALFPDSLLLAKAGKKPPKDKLGALARKYMGYPDVSPTSREARQERGGRYRALDLQEYDFGQRASDYETAATLTPGREKPKGSETSIGGAVLPSTVFRVLDRLGVLESDADLSQYNAAYKDLLKFGDPDFYADQLKQLEDMMDMASARKPEGLDAEDVALYSDIISGLREIHDRIGVVRKLEEDLGLQGQLLPDELNPEMSIFLQDRHNFLHQTGEASPIVIGGPIVRPAGRYAGPLFDRSEQSFNSNVDGIAGNISPRVDADSAANSDGSVGTKSGSTRGEEPVIRSEGQLRKAGDEMFVYQGSLRQRLTLREDGTVSSVLEREVTKPTKKIEDKMELRTSTTLGGTVAELREGFDEALGGRTKGWTKESTKQENLGEFLKAYAEDVNTNYLVDERVKATRRGETLDDIQPILRKEVTDFIGEVFAPKTANEKQWTNFASIKNVPDIVTRTVQLTDPTFTLTPQEEAFIKLAVQISRQKDTTKRKGIFTRMMSVFEGGPNTKIYERIGVEEVLQQDGAVVRPAEPAPIDKPAPTSPEVSASKLIMPDANTRQTLWHNEDKLPKGDELVVVEHATDKKWIDLFLEEGVDASVRDPNLDMRMGRLTTQPEGGVRQTPIEEAGLYVSPAGEQNARRVVLVVKASEVGLSPEAAGLGYTSGMAGLYGAADAIISKKISAEDFAGAFDYNTKTKSWEWTPNPKSPYGKRFYADDWQLKQVEVPSLQGADLPDRLYHVFPSEQIGRISKDGLRPYEQNIDAGVEGTAVGRLHDGTAVYGFEKLEDAVRYALEKDWEGNQSFGTGKFSVVEFGADLRNWSKDDKIGLGSEAVAQSDGFAYYRQGQVSAEDLISVREIKGKPKLEEAPAAEVPPSDFAEGSVVTDKLFERGMSGPLGSGIYLNAKEADLQRDFGTNLPYPEWDSDYIPDFPPSYINVKNPLVVDGLSVGGIEGGFWYEIGDPQTRAAIFALHAFGKQTNLTLSDLLHFKLIDQQQYDLIVDPNPKARVDGRNKNIKRFGKFWEGGDPLELEDSIFGEKLTKGTLLQRILMLADEPYDAIVFKTRKNVDRVVVFDQENVSSYSSPPSQVKVSGPKELAANWIKETDQHTYPVSQRPRGWPSDKDGYKYFYPIEESLGELEDLRALRKYLSEQIEYKRSQQTTEVLVGSEVTYGGQQNVLPRDAVEELESYAAPGILVRAISPEEGVVQPTLDPSLDFKGYFFEIDTANNYPQMLGEWQLTPAQAEKTVVLKVPPALQTDTDIAAIPFPRKRGLGDLPLTKKQIEEKVSDVWFDKENDWGIDKSYTVQLYRAEEFARSLVEKHREAVLAETNRKIKKLEEDHRFPLEDKVAQSLDKFIATYGDSFSPSELHFGAQLTESSFQNRLYHGTKDPDIQQLRPSSYGQLGAGVYLSPDPDIASTYALAENRNSLYAAGENPNVLPVYARVGDMLLVEDNPAFPVTTNVLLAIGEISDVPLSMLRMQGTISDLEYTVLSRPTVRQGTDSVDSSVLRIDPGDWDTLQEKGIRSLLDRITSSGMDETSQPYDGIVYRKGAWLDGGNTTEVVIFDPDRAFISPIPPERLYAARDYAREKNISAENLFKNAGMDNIETRRFWRKGAPKFLDQLYYERLSSPSLAEKNPRRKQLTTDSDPYEYPAGEKPLDDSGQLWPDLTSQARESLEPSAPEPFNPQFLQKAVQNQLVKLRRNQLPAVRKKTIAEGQVSPGKVVETTLSLVETPLPEGVTVARGSQQALANIRAFGGAEILRSDLPPVLFGVSLSGVPTSLSATRRAGGRTSANVSLFTSEATAADYALTYRNAVEIARQEVLPDNIEKTIETLHKAIIADRHMGMIPDELYADNLTKWLNFASEEGQKFWAANNDSPTEVYKAYLRERNAALGIKVNPVTLSVKQLAKRKVDGVTVTKVNKNDIPKEALVVGDIPNAINNVRVFSDKLKLYNRASAGILPELIFAANVPVNRLGLRIVPRADELRLFSPATTRTKQGRSKGIGLTPRQRRIQSLPSTVEGPATKPKAFDTPEEGPRRSTKNLASLVGGTWSAKFIEKIKGEIPDFLFREALRLRDADLKAVFVDGDWNPSLAGQMDSLVNQTDPQPLLSMSTATKKQQALELWKLATGQPRTKNLDVITIADFIRGEFPKTYSGVKLKQLTKKTRDKFGKETEVPGDFVPETVEIVPNPKVIDPKTGKPRTETLVVYETKGDSPNIPVLDDDGKQIKEQFNYYRYVRGNREDSIPRHYILKGREELRQHLKDTMTNSGERRINAMEKVVILSNLFSHMQRRGANAGWWGKSMAATRDKFARAFDLANFSQASKLAADVVRAEEGIKYQIERGLYSAQLDANLLAHNAGLASVAEIHQGIHQTIKNNSESAWDVTSDPRKNQPGTSLQWKNLNAYFHGTPEKGFKDGVWAVLERGETPVNPPSVQRKIAAGEELEVYDVTGEQLRLYADILNDMYMESVLYELAKESQNSLDPDKFLKIAFENYFPRYYDMNLSRRVFEQKRNAGIETYGDFMSDRLEAAGISELSGSQLHQDFWEPSTPFEQQLRDAFYRVRQGTPATSAEEVLWGGRRKTWQKMKAAGIDPQDFGFVYGGTDRISEMINAGFVPSTSNIVELYQFKRGQIDKYLQKRKVYRVLEEANAIQTIPEKTFKALRNHYTKSTGHDILEFFDIVGVGNKVDPEEKYKAQDGGSLSKARERSLGLAKLLDNEAEKKVDADKIILMDKNAALLVSRFFQPESLYQPGAKHLLVPQDAYRVWRETNNILQNVQLGIGFFHVGTMISESMGTSLESLSAALFHINKRKTAEGMIEYPRPLGDEKLGPAKIPVEVEQSLMMGRLLKFGLAGLAVVRDAGHQEGLHRGLASKLGLPEEKASKGSRKYTRYPKGGSLPLQILATFYAPLKRDSAFIKSFQEKVAKFINNRRAKKGLPETVSPEELFTGVPVRNNSMEQLDKSMGALIEHMSTGILPENATESVIKSVIQQMILGNMQFPSQIYGTKFQLELAKKGQSMVETTVNRLQRGEDLFNYGSVPDPAYIEGFKKLANRTVNMSAWMFDSMIPQAKLAGFLERFRYTLAELGPDATPFQIRKAAQQIQDSIDNRFGQVHYPNLFWEQKSREIMHLTIRSVGWNMGTLKEVLYGGPKDAIKYGLLKTVRAGEAALGVPKAQRKASVGEIDKWSTRAGYASVMIPWKIVQGSMLQLALAGSLPEIAYDEDGNINFVKTLRNFIAPLDGQFDSLGRPTRILSPDYARDVGSLLIAGSEGGLLGLGGALGTMSWHKASPTVHYLTGLASAYAGPNKTFFGREIIRSKGTGWGKAQDFLAYSGEQLLPFAVGTAWYQLSTLDQPLNSALFNGLFGFTPANAWYRNSALDRHLSTAYDDSSGPAIDNLSYEEKLMMEELFQTIRSGWNSEELGKRTEAFEALNQLFNTLPPENVPSIVAQWEGFSPTVGRLIRDILDISNPLDTRSHRDLARATLTQVLDARGIGTLRGAGSVDKWKDIQKGFKTKPLTAVDSKIKSTNSAFIRESDNPAFVAAAVAVATPFERAIMITADHLGRYGKPPENYVQKTLTKEDLEIFGGNTGSVELGQRPFSPMIRAYFNSRVSDETRTDIKSDIYHGRFQEKLFDGTEIEMANDLVFPFMAGQAIPQETIDKYGPEDLDQQSRILLERHNKIVEANPPIPPTNMRIK